MIYYCFCCLPKPNFTKYTKIKPPIMACKIEFDAKMWRWLNFTSIAKKCVWMNLMENWACRLIETEPNGWKKKRVHYKNWMLLQQHEHRMSLNDENEHKHEFEHTEAVAGHYTMANWIRLKIRYVYCWPFSWSWGRDHRALSTKTKYIGGGNEDI